MQPTLSTVQNRDSGATQAIGSQFECSPKSEMAQIVNLEVYPLDQLDSGTARDLVAHCRRDLAASGSCELKGFVTGSGLQKLVIESRALEPLAFHNAVVGNAYLDEPDAALPEDHVRRMTEPTSLGAVGYDQFPEYSVLRKIFEWDPLRLFIGEVLQLPAIYRYGDPMGALNLAVMKNGDYLRWHFDQTDFVTSLAIQEAEEGGYFEYVPMIRNAEQENYDQVRRILQGNREGVITVRNQPGSLILFKGRYSMHRVTPIQGTTSRLIGLLGFDANPDIHSSEHLKRMRYGRTMPLR